MWWFWLACAFAWISTKKKLCNFENVTVNVLPLKIHAKGNAKKERTRTKANQVFSKWPLRFGFDNFFFSNFANWKCMWKIEFSTETKKKEWLEKQIQLDQILWLRNNLRLFIWTLTDVSMMTLCITVEFYHNWIICIELSRF